ncbi:PIG-L family deacetylase [Nocardia sp. NPDC004568]|uniref:PIG-L family deacetylase n=1 Tax=Nocardia sp. NPDC004568 TaxID=3154551 RepID=UPI0033A5B996
MTSVQIDWRQQRVLVIAAHPDDEVIGSGGLISRVKREGGQVHVLYAAIDDLVEYSPAGGSTARQRWAEIEQVAEFRRTLRLDASPRAELVDLLEGRPEHGVALLVLRPTVVVAPEVTYVSLGRRLRYPTAICATISRGSDETM